MPSSVSPLVSFKNPSTKTTVLYYHAYYTFLVINMKLIIGGATGFVAEELIRECLKNSAITSIIALGRRETSPPSDAGASASKLKSIIIEDFESYSDSIKKEIENADACIWYVLPYSYSFKTLSYNRVF